MEKQINKDNKYRLDKEIIEAFKKSKSTTINEFILSLIESDSTKKIIAQNDEIYAATKTQTKFQEYLDKNTRIIINNQNRLEEQNKELIRMINSAVKGLDE